MQKPLIAGAVSNDEDVATLLGWAHELGCNYVRLAHYPHDQRMTRRHRSDGILVWSEIPSIGPNTLGSGRSTKGRTAVDEEIRRDRDRLDNTVVDCK